jgi:hypothetical protein
MVKRQQGNIVYEMMYNYKYMLETGYTFDEYARTIKNQIEIRERNNNNVEDKQPDETLQ